MSSQKSLPLSSSPSNPVRSFYRPHARVTFTGEVTNPITGEVTRPPSMTKQSFKDECDINTILRQYKVTGMISHISAQAAQGAYLELPAPMDFQDSLELVRRAQDSFATLPSVVRDRFNNNAQAFLAFCADPKNLPEMEKLGLLKPAAGGGGLKPPEKPPVVAPAPAEPPSPPKA